MDFVELRGWLTLGIITISASVALKTLLDNGRQRKLENTFKMLDYIRKHITDEQIATFQQLFDANNEIAGVPYNEFRFSDGRIDNIEGMFSEGGCGNGDIQNMIEVFNLISKFLNNNTLNAQLIWYEYGQIMSTCYRWTKYIDDKNLFKVPKSRRSIFRKKTELFTPFYSDFNSYMKKPATLCQVSR